MSGFWNTKTSTMSLILAGFVDASLFIAVSDNSRFGYWPPIVLLIGIILSLLNNVRIDRLERRIRTRGEEGNVEA